jgi:hypothetical protein
MRTPALDAIARDLRARDAVGYDPSDPARRPARQMSRKEIEAELAELGGRAGSWAKTRRSALQQVIAEKNMRGEDAREDIPEENWHVFVRSQDPAGLSVARRFTTRARGPSHAEEKARKFYEDRGHRIKNVMAEGRAP